MQDDTEYLETRDGVLIDIQIEAALVYILDEDYENSMFNTVYTKLVRRWINPNCPDLFAAYAGKDHVNCGAVNYLAMLGLDSHLIFKNGYDWPTFEQLPSATCAVAILHSDGVTWTDLHPGNGVNHAVIGSLIQLCRELSSLYHSQPTLFESGTLH